jgi:branched-chain amino acid transport system ATP-binding protein
MQTMSPDDTILQADCISVRFGGLTALADVSLALSMHRIIGLIGPNGAGKTTLINCLTGFQKPTQGSVSVCGKSTSHWSAEEFRKWRVARTFQAGRLFSDMLVIENVEVCAVALGATRRHAKTMAAELLEWVSLSGKADSIAGSLPYTDQRRLGLARALVCEPRFLLLDEPAAGMSDAECEALIGMISRIPKEFSCGVLLIEHNMNVVMSISDYVHVLDGGRTIGTGTPREIQSNEAVLAAYLGIDP